MNWFKPKPSHNPDMFTVGRRYDSLPMKLRWPYLPHTLISGITRSGKSSWVNAIISGASDHPNTAMVFIDPKQIELAQWAPRATSLAHTGTQATETLTHVVELMGHRKQILTRHGVRTWNLDYGPAVLIVVEELAELKAIGGKDPIDLLCSIARLSAAFGFTLICTTQYPLVSIVPSELRSNLEGRIAGRVTGSEQFEVALGKGIADHINPNSIGKNEPGVAYVHGFDGYDTVTKCRAHYLTDNYITQKANHTARLHIPAEQLYPTPPANNSNTAA